LLTTKEFTNEFKSCLTAKLSEAKIVIEQPLHLKVAKPEGTTFYAFLNNAYAQYRTSPENKAEVIEKYAAAIIEMRDTEGDLVDKQRIVPVVKDKNWLRETQQSSQARANAKPLDYVWEIYNEELVILFAEDRSASMRFLTIEDLAILKIQLQDLRELACANLTRILPTQEIQSRGEIYRIMGGGDYDASLLLLNHFWENAKLDIRGELVVAIPSRDCLLATGGENEKSLCVLREFAAKIRATGHHTLTSKLFARRNGRFMPFS